MNTIKKIVAYEIIDSRGFPTVEARLWLSNGVEVTTSIPSGTSIGKYEALELRDGDKARFNGMGVTKSVSYINELIGPKLVGIAPTMQKEIDNWLIKADGTPNKSRLGSNTTLAISQLVMKAGALERNLPLYKYINSVYESYFKEKIKVERIPSPIFNCLNGGKHASNNLEFQEFQIIPSSSFTFADAYRMGVELYHELKLVLAERSANLSVGEEGGFAPNFSTNVDALEVLTEAVAKKNLKVGMDVFFGLDIAASHFFDNDRYIIRDKTRPLKVEEYINFVVELTKNYTLLCLEDPLNQDDWESWKKLNKTISTEMYLVGDDLLTTNKERLMRAIKEKACTTILVKPNQIGTITETLEVINIARTNNFNYTISHRSGETNDTFIADFAVGLQSDFVKFGAPSRGERVAKYNRLWQIERDGI